MNAPWQTKSRCDKCDAALRVTVEPAELPEPALAIFYCPTCGARGHVDVPAGYDPLTVAAAPDESD